MPPPEIITLGYIDRFGAEAVMGRALGYGEIRRMILAENIVRVVRDQAHAENAADWANEHPSDAALLAECIRLANNG